MSDMHVLSGHDSDWDVVMHFPVPDANNDVGVSYADAIVASGIGGVTRMTEGTGPGQIVPAEKALIEAGQVYEHRKDFLVESGGTSTANLRATLRDFYAKEKAHQVARIRESLRYFGHTESEA